MRQWDGRIGRWMTTDPYGQYASPYLGMGNNPINIFDPNGGVASPIYDFDGEHLGNDSEGFFGEVIYMDEENFVEGMDHKLALKTGFSMNKALSDGLITIHDLRRTIDNIIYEGALIYEIDLVYLYNSSVSIHSFAGITSNAKFNDFNGQRGNSSNSSAFMVGKNAISVNFFVKGGTGYTTSGRIFGGQISNSMTHTGNIISAFVHEYLGHGNHLLFKTSERRAYNIQRFHPSIENTTPAYKQHVINRFDNYNR